MVHLSRSSLAAYVLAGFALLLGFSILIGGALVFRDLLKTQAAPASSAIVTQGVINTEPLTRGEHTLTFIGDDGEVTSKKFTLPAVTPAPSVITPTPSPSAAATSSPAASPASGYKLVVNTGAGQPFGFSLVKTGNASALACGSVIVDGKDILSVPGLASCPGAATPTPAPTPSLTDTPTLAPTPSPTPVPTPSPTPIPTPTPSPTPVANGADLVLAVSAAPQIGPGIVEIKITNPSANLVTANLTVTNVGTIITGSYAFAPNVTNASGLLYNVAIAPNNGFVKRWIKPQPTSGCAGTPSIVVTVSSNTPDPNSANNTTPYFVPCS